MEALEIEKRQIRCQKFLELRSVERPLLGVMWEPAITPVREYLERVPRDRPASPEDVSAEEMCDAADHIIALADQIPQDLFHATQASFNHQWLEAILGARIWVREETIWAGAGELSLADLATFELGSDNAWYSKMVECHRKLVQHGRGRYPVSTPVLHGPLDLLVSVIGSAENVALSIHDDPGLLEAAMDRVTSVWCRAARDLAGSLEPFANGFLSRMHVWTPAPNVTTQDDATWMMSPENYRLFVQPFERRMCAAAPNAVHHTHNTSAHLLELLGELDLTVVQMSVDANGPPWERQRTAIRRVQETKPVLLTVWSLEDADRALKDLDPRGLGVTVVAKIKEGDLGTVTLEQYTDWYQAKAK
jgi:hypothetical protein